MRLLLLIAPMRGRAISVDKIMKISEIVGSGVMKYGSFIEPWVAIYNYYKLSTAFSYTSLEITFEHRK